MAKPNAKPAKTTWQIFAEGLLRFIRSRNFLYIIFAWFILQAGFMAMSTKPGIPPDELTHVRAISVYANDDIDPFLQSQPPETYYIGAITRVPDYAYHYSLSFIERVVPDSLPPTQHVVILRFINIGLSVLGLIVLCKVFDLLSDKTEVRNLSLFMLTNTLMFVFLAASVNYDNLLLLVTAGILYYFVKLYKKFELLDFLKLLILMLIGPLVKFTILPLAAMLMLWLIIHYRKQYKTIWRSTQKSAKRNRAPAILLAILVVLGLGLFAERYGMNTLRYGTFDPQCDQILSFENCKRSALFSRNLAFRENSVSTPIPGVGFSLRWLDRMKGGVYGLFVHKVAPETIIIKYGIVLIVAIMIVAMVKTKNKNNKLLYGLLLVSVLYAGIIYYNNYILFAKSGISGLAVQGRYLFPIIGIVYFSGNMFVSQWLQKKPTQYALYVLLVLLIFITAGLPAYLLSTGPDWHTATFVGLNTHIRSALQIVLP